MSRYCFRIAGVVFSLTIALAATGSARAQRRAGGPPQPDYDAFYELGPDSLVRRGVPKGIGQHSHDLGGAMLPEMLRWLWRDQPVSTDPNDTAERAFRALYPLPRRMVGLGGVFKTTIHRPDRTRVSGSSR